LSFDVFFHLFQGVLADPQIHLLTEASQANSTAHAKLEAALAEADADASIAADAYAYYSNMKTSMPDSASEWARYKLRTAERRAQTTAAAAAASAAAVRVAKVSAQLLNNEYYSTQASLALEAASAASDARSSAETRAANEAEKARSLQDKVEKLQADVEIQIKVSEDLKSAQNAAEAEMRDHIQKLDASLAEAREQEALFAESIRALELDNKEANTRALALQEQLDFATAANAKASEPLSETEVQKNHEEADVDIKGMSEALSKLEADAATKVAEIEKSMRAWADKEVATVAARTAVQLKDAQDAILAAEASAKSIEAAKRALEVELSAQVEKGGRLESEVEELKETLAAYDAEAAQAASETALGGRVQELEAALRAAQGQEKNLQSSLQELESTRKDTHNQLVTLQKDFDAAMAATEAASKNSKDLKAKIVVLQETVASQASALELASLTDSSNKEYRRQIAQLSADLEKARELAESRGALLEESFETLHIEQRESEIALLQAQRELKAAEAEAAQASAKAENLQEKFDVAVEEIASLISQRDAAEEEVTSLAAQRNAAETDESALTAQPNFHDSTSNVQAVKIVSALRRMQSQVLVVAAAFSKAARNQVTILKQVQEQNMALGKTEFLQRLTQRLPFMNTADSSKAADRTPKRPIVAWLSVLSVASLAIFFSIFEVSFGTV